MSTWIMTNSGKQFDLLNPPELIDIEDIAHALSHICRFGGMCRKFYSVAEHSVHVSSLLPDSLAMCGLLHDATEAFLGDVTRPLKKLLLDYQQLEQKVHVAISRCFGIPLFMPQEVKDADNLMLATEARELMPAQIWTFANINIPTVETANINIKCWRPKLAKFVFLARYNGILRNTNGAS